MDIVILSIAALAFLGWVLILKVEVIWLRRDNARLKEQVDRQARMLKTGVDVSESRRLSKGEVAGEEKRTLRTTATPAATAVPAP